MNQSIKPGMVIIEFNELPEGLMTELRALLQYKTYSPLRPMEYPKDKNGERVWHYSGCFTPDQETVLREWIDLKGIKAKVT